MISEKYEKLRRQTPGSTVPAGGWSMAEKLLTYVRGETDNRSVAKRYVPAELCKGSFCYTTVVSNRIVCVCVGVCESV